MSVNSSVQPPVPKGYPKLANLMGPYPELAIFRRFGTLTMLNLMSLQAELIDIEFRLEGERQKDDASDDPTVRTYSENLNQLNKSTVPNNSQRLLLESSRTKLQEYHSLLLQAAQVSQLYRPEKHRLSVLRKWLRGKEEGDSFQKDLELVRTWDEIVERDLITISQRSAEGNELERWFKPAIALLYNRTWANKRVPVDNESGKVYDYEDSKFTNSTKWILTMLATIIASLIPALTILWLNSISRTVVRIWVTIGLTAGLGVILKLFTNATMKEIFGATSAFAAVEVVFIGSANGKSS